MLVYLFPAGAEDESVANVCVQKKSNLFQQKY